MWTSITLFHSGLTLPVRNWRLLPVIAVLATTMPAFARTEISLDGSGWRLYGLQIGEGERLGLESRTSLNGGVSVEVPSDVQQFILKDPWGQGQDVVDINKKEWWYTRLFPTPKGAANHQVRLVLDGVDYFAQVWLNGTQLGSHEGAYTRFEFDVTDLLRSGSENYLAVKVTAPWNVPGRSHYEFMKGEFEEWWDALPGPGQVVFPLGLHRSVRLEVTSAARVSALRVWTVALKDASAEVKSQIQIANRNGAKQLTAQITIRPENFTGEAVTLPPRKISFGGDPASQDLEFVSEIHNPRLWWTWDQGPQNLYRAEAVISDDAGVVLDRFSTVFGIRTLERDANLLYRINGRPVFFRGAWYPMSRLYPASTDRWTYEKDLRLARNANMNHLVNYTVVEKDEFYELADRLGILVFIELPFNQEGPIDALNAKYPRRAEFIRWASSETAQIVRALANHPSVGVWAAVSEVTENGKDFSVGWDPRVAEAADGYDLFVKAIGHVVEENDPDSLYFRGYCDFGEHHFWEGAFFDGSTYDQQFDAVAPFVSEYGALAFFPPESIRRIIDPKEVWEPGAGKWSPVALPIHLKRMSYVHPWQLFGLDFFTANIASNVERHIGSFDDYIYDSQFYQAFLYGYAGDAYRRKLFNPINGARSWMFKSFPEIPIGGFGVIDAFDTPTRAYYEQKRTFAPVSMSFATRYPLESLPTGSPWSVPVWVSNASPEDIPSVSVESTLYSLSGQLVATKTLEASLPANKSQMIFEMKETLPDISGVYVLRGRVKDSARVLAESEQYLKVVPRATRKTLRVLLVGTPEWTQPMECYLRGLGAAVTTVVSELTIIRPPRNPFPNSAAELRKNYDVIWLAGFNNYWREAPEEWTAIIREAVDSGVSFVHTGSLASFHGGGEKAAALDLTSLSQLLPVEVGHENDVLLKSSFKVGKEPNGLAVKDTELVIEATPDAPSWLKAYNFGATTPDSYHLLRPRGKARTLLEMGGTPLLVSGQFGKGRTYAYMGFTPQGSMRLTDSPVILDRVIRASSEARLMTTISAALLALASGEDPAASLAELLERRESPLYETLKGLPQPAWPDITVSWISQSAGRVRIQNGAGYSLGLRLRLDGPAMASGQAVALWNNQFFDLLPGEMVEADFSILSRGQQPGGPVALVAEGTASGTIKRYEITQMSQ
jgi:beta-mannosidase